MTDTPTLDLAEIKRLAEAAQSQNCELCNADSAKWIACGRGRCAASRNVSVAVPALLSRLAAAEQERDRLRVVAEAVAAVILDERQPDGRGGVWVVTGQAKLTVVADALAALRAAIETPGPGTGRE